MKPFFSVIIPTLNEAKFIPFLLNDLVEQKEKFFEVIIVDALSSDETKKVVANLSKSLSLRFYQHKSNVSQGRNYGAKKAKGEYLIFLDADARINSNFIKILLAAIKDKGLFFIPAIIPDSNNIELKIAFKFANFLVELSQNTKKPFSTGGSMAIDKNLFNKIGGFDATLFLSEDHNLVQKAQLWGVKAKFLHNLELKFSMRRMRREGRLTLFYKYLYSTIHVLVKGDVKNKLFPYQMGGGIYKFK
jgi:glycosyltransferase involved in cell wall biosynthesis